MFSTLVAAQSGTRGRRGARGYSSGFGALGSVADQGTAVQIGDTVLVSFTAGYGFQANPLAQPTQVLQSRLQQQGFEVLSVDANALSSLEAAATLGWGGRGTVLVIVRPITKAYPNPALIAWIVIQAAQAAGFSVENYSERGEVTARAAPGAEVPTEAQNRQSGSKVVQPSIFSQLAGAFNLTGATDPNAASSALKLGLVAAALLGVIILVKR